MKKAEGSISFETIKATADALKPFQDELAVEEALQIELHFANDTTPLVITMRTPGTDDDLALGYLFSEGIISSFDKIDKLIKTDPNSIRVYLNGSPERDMSKLKRSDISTGACGVCGKSSMEGIFLPDRSLAKTAPHLHYSSIISLAQSTKKSQNLFNKTGGIHASALFNTELKLLDLKEDIGRHNSLDKLIGSNLKNQFVDFQDSILFVSGRAGFELVQKALVARIPIMIAVGAPSSLAVHWAEKSGITLIGFLKEDSFNIYTHSERILAD